MEQVEHSYHGLTHHGTSDTLVPGPHKQWNKWNTRTTASQTMELVVQSYQAPQTKKTSGTLVPGLHKPRCKCYIRTRPSQTMTQVVHSNQALTNHGTSGTLAPGPTNNGAWYISCRYVVVDISLCKLKHKRYGRVNTMHLDARLSCTRAPHKTFVPDPHIVNPALARSNQYILQFTREVPLNMRGKLANIGKHTVSFDFSNKSYTKW